MTRHIITHRLSRILPAAMLTAVILAVMASCSTTRRLPEGEILYTGVKKVDYQTDRDTRLAEGVSDDISEAVKVKPNNSLLGSASIRYPFPLGLWVYNNWPNPPGGFKHWIYEKLSTEPVLVSDVRPEVRTQMIDQILDNNGYFRGTSSYELVSGKNKRKASILYKINPGPVYRLSSVELLPDTCHLYHMIDSIASGSKYLHAGARYSTDSLSEERVRITNVLRNRGYYFFQPSYIEYLADSTIAPQKIALKMTIVSNAPEMALRRYRTGRITTTVYRNDGTGTPDTFQTSRGTVIQMQPSHLRKSLIPSCIAIREGRTFSVRSMNTTQSRLSRLGIFNGIDIQAYPDTTAESRDLLNVDISCVFDKPLEATAQANVSSKSNSYLGPGVVLGVTNKNIFGGGEQLSINLTGSYEWQTGHNSRSVFNSYEIGLSASLSFPRLLAPKFIPRSRRDLNWTRIALNADLLNRPHYFRMAQLNGSFAYDWRVNKYVTNTLTPFKLTYTQLQHTTAEFDSIMGANPAIALSFRSQFMPQINYSFNYDRTFDNGNSLNWQFTVMEAGNICWALWNAFGDHGEKKLLGIPMSQFVKGTMQLVYGRRLFGNHWLVNRVAVGAAHAYGNSTEVPYSEQFYCGGANSVRAFTVRSLGPGSYRPPRDLVNGYFDQTGTFKFEANVEYRFPILGPLYGAVFLDAGNVWLLKKDPDRPGGELKGSTFLRDLALGTGAGLRFDIGMIVVRGDLGIGIHAPYDTGKRGYYNMTSFGNSLAFHLAIGYPF